MDLTREERMQQRLRGAQKRQVKDVDFGLVFPAAEAPAQPAVPARRIPQPDLSPQSESLPQAELQPQPSTRRTPGLRALPADTTPAQESSRPINDANISAKRRKLDTDVPLSSSTRSTRSSRRVRRPDIYALPEDEQQDSSAVETTNASIERVPDSIPERESTPQAPLPQTTTTPGEEITESPRDAPGSGHRIRTLDRITAMSSQLQIVQSSSPADVKAGAETPVPLKKQKTGEAVPKSPAPGLPLEERSQTNRPNPGADDVDELSPEQPTRRGRRPKSTARKELLETEKRDPLSDPVEEHEEAEAIDDAQAAALLKKNRGRRVSRNFPAGSPDLGESEISISVPKKRKRKHHGDFSPVQQRQPQPKKSIKSPKKTTKKAKLRAGNPIPVTVHRLTRPVVYEEDEPDADILNAEIPCAKRGGVNAIDVLSQICQEIVGTGLDTLEDGGNNCEDPALRREYKTKWRAVHSFGEELQTRLLEHTVNLDNSYSLERRVRDEQKKKLGLREEILRIRAEREQVALRMDEIRIKHENETKSFQERDALNTAIHDIVLAVEIGKTTETRHEPSHTVEMAGIEVLLKRVAGKASSKGGSVGMLRQIKDFNSFLERAALVLESRKV